jgi:two-component sensor histidine kinase
VFITKDGYRKIGEVNTSPLIRDGKVIAMISVARDITERKQAEDFIKKSLEEKEILLREIHHRVKNNMQLIISLLNLQARNIKDEDMKLLYKDAEYRIKAMSLVHEKLYLSENLARIDFSEYIRSIFNQLSAMYHIISDEISLELNSDHVELGVDLAVPSGLIVNEILTNSFKHAFPSNFTGPGKITVSLRESQYNIIELIISDNGIGAHQKMDLNKKDSLGMLLISILTKQLNGTVTLDNHAGTAFTIIFRNEI